MLVECVEAIRTRRSVRRFQPDPVPQHLLEAVLDAAAHAPSAKNVRNWVFVVLEVAPKAALVDLMWVAAEEVGDAPGYSVRGTALAMGQAPVLVAVHNNRGLLRSGFDSVEEAAGGLPDQVLQIVRDLEIQGLAAATQNLLLAAHALGLGGLWIGDFHFARDQIQALLKPFCSHELVALVALGYPLERPTTPATRRWQEVTVWASDL